MHEVIMPKLGLTMESGKIEKWHKKEGDRVAEGDVLFEVMTDKVSLEVESYNSGILKKIIKGEGEEVPVTEVVAYIGSEDEVFAEPAAKEPGEDIKKQEPEVARKETGKTALMEHEEEIPEDEDKIKISPLARKMASENNVDISMIEGSGPRGRIVKKDVEEYMASAGSMEEKKIKISPRARKKAKELGIDWKSAKVEGSGPGGRIVESDILAYSKKVPEKAEAVEEAATGKPRISSRTELTGMRKVIAERMSLSKSTIPHIVLNAKADVTDFIKFREQLKEMGLKKYDVKITFTDLILKAAAMALKENIGVNSSLQENEYIVYEDINVGMAIAVEEGLIVPTIFSCDKLKIVEIAKKRVDLIDKAKNNKLSLDEIEGGTFTVTNLGMFSIRNFSAIINPPQAAILAVGEIYQEPAAIDGKVQIRAFMDVSVSCDHRIVDGVKGARFVQDFVELIENPAMLVI
jgi:pyruvate dehydrogenase E2 component (dihydrolipoamide acetyltransferase)